MPQPLSCLNSADKLFIRQLSGAVCIDIQQCWGGSIWGVEENNESSRMSSIFWKNGLSRKSRVGNKKRQRWPTPLKRHPGVWSLEEWHMVGSNEETSSGPSDSCWMSMSIRCLGLMCLWQCFEKNILDVNTVLSRWFCLYATVWIKQCTNIQSIFHPPLELQLIFHPLLELSGLF